MTGFVAWILETTAITLLATAAIAIVPASLPALRHRLWWLTLSIVVGLPAIDAWSDSIVWTAASTAGTIATNSALAAADSARHVADSVSVTGWVLPAPPAWLTYPVVGLWALFALAALTKLIQEAAAAMYIARTATPVSDALIGRWRAVADARAHGRRVRIASADIRGACAIGLGTPSIVIGDTLLAQMDEAETETIVLHEYAHLRRYDDWTQLAQRVILAFAGFHPAVRSISRRIDIEREAACDQLASRQSGSAITCARALASAAEIATRHTGLPMRAVPAASLDDGGLQGRVTRLLADQTVRPWIASSVALIEAAVILAAGTAVFQTQPVVDFQMSSADGMGAATVVDSAFDSGGEPQASKVLPVAEQSSGSDSAVQPSLGPATVSASTVESSRRTSITPVSEKVSAVVAAEPPRQKSQPERAHDTGSILAALGPVAVRGAEHPEHTATLAQTVSSATRPDTVDADALPAQTLTPRVSAPLDVARLEWASLDALATSRWSQATERSADVGRSAASAGQVIGRFFQSQGRAIARRF